VKITNITCIVANAGRRNILFVKTETDEGLVGWGRRTVSAPTWPQP